jgi:hypothetical protein
MGANPKPGNDIAFTQTQRAIMISDTNYANTVATFLKAQGWMIGMAFPDRLLFAG